MIVSWAAYRFIRDTNLLEANLGDLKTLKKKKNFVNVVSNTNQMVLFLPAQNLKLWKGTFLICLFSEPIWGNVACGQLVN